MSKSTVLSKDHSLTSINFEKNDHSITSIDFAERFTNKISTEDNKWGVHNSKFVTFVSDFPHKLGCTMSCELSREKKEIISKCRLLRFAPSVLKDNYGKNI